MRRAGCIICGLLLLLSACDRAKPSTRTTRSPSAPSISLSPSPSPRGFPSEEPTPEDLGKPGVFFLDALHGWAGGRGTVFRTSDGGRTWRHRIVGGRHYVSMIRFADRAHGFALQDGRLLRSSDGGAAWTRMPAAPEPLVAIDVGGIRHVWGIGSGEHLVETRDGGQTWRTSNLTRVQSVCFTGRDRGWVAGHRRILMTTDGGGSWTPSYKARTPENPDADFEATVRCSASGVWALFADGGASNQQSYFVVRSLDAGRHWRAIAQGTYISILGMRDPLLEDIGAYSGPFVVTSATVGVFIGVCYTCDPQPAWFVTVTTDAGTTWGPTRLIAPTPTYWDLDDVAFIDAERGWLVGGLETEQRGEVRLTRDGGRTWRILFRSALL